MTRRATIMLRRVTVLGLALALVAAVPAVVSAAPGERSKQAPGQVRQAETVPGRYIVVFRPSVINPGATTEALERGRGFRAEHRYSRALKGFTARLSDAQVAALQHHPDIELVTPDRPVQASGVVPLVPKESPPTGVRRIEAGTTTTARQASTANVAVLDTGIDLDHGDLNAVHGKNCTGSGPADDDQGHGTHVAGSVAALNNGAGITGVAPGTKVYAVKVLDAKGAGTFSQIICGIDWVTSTRTDPDPGNDIAVANLSLGGSGSPVGTCATTTDPLHRAICNSIAVGVTYVVAAGNSGWDFDDPSVPDVPAAYPEVLTVSAAADSDGRPGALGGSPACDSRQSDDTHATFSNYASTPAGAAHLVAAPGVCIFSTYPANRYAIMSGTSMAAPHVAGVVALCLGEAGAAGPCSGLTPAQVTARILSDAKARSGESLYGFTGDPLRMVSGRSYGHLVWANNAGPAANARYHPLAPSRILDTRSGNGAPAAKVGPGARVDLQVTGRGGVPTTGVSAVVVNVTVTEPTAGSHLTAWPTGSARPVASNLNYSAGKTVPNLVVAKVGTGGKVSLFNNSGSTHVIADVVGWYDDGNSTSGALFSPLSPSRILDTRSGNGAPAAKVGPGASVDLQVTGRGGVPTSGVSAVVVNVTVTEPTAGSHLTAWPTGSSRPLASNLNYTAGQTVPNLVVAKVGAGGKVSLFNNSGQTHVIADVVGWYGAEGATTGPRYTSLVPARILDTRSGNGAPAAKVGAGASVDLQVTGRGGVPTSGVSAVVVNVTVTEPTAGSHLTAWPTGSSRPLASNLNYTAGQTVPNLVVAKVGAGGKVSLFNNSGQTHVIADVVGWY
ncbi:MAG: S8 family serine peptidase, partial [Actinobacteria bacterium]|nr:S8 family serine peptidase [Actinomycetota bacterium]